MSHIEIEEFLHNIIGAEVTMCRVTYGGSIKLNLNKKQDGIIEKWNILSRQCSWRVLHYDHIVCGSEDEIEDIDDALSGLEMGEIIKTSQNWNLDFSLITSNGFRFDFLTNSVWDPQLTIDNRETAFKLTQEGWLEIDNAELKSLYDKTLSAIDFYSKECTERWRNRVPKIQGGNSCDSCFYYRCFGGSFYFWKYGVCSNKNSEYDGKLVSNQSGCIHYAELKNIISMNIKMK